MKRLIWEVVVLVVLLVQLSGCAGGGRITPTPTKTSVLGTSTRQETPVPERFRHWFINDLVALVKRAGPEEFSKRIEGWRIQVTGTLMAVSEDGTDLGLRRSYDREQAEFTVICFLREPITWDPNLFLGKQITIEAVATADSTLNSGMPLFKCRVVKQ